MYRVEESLQLILTAFGVQNVKVFAIPSIIMISFKLNDHLYAGQFRLKGNGINLERLEQLNALSRRICAGELTLEQAEGELAAILSRKRYPAAVSYVAFGIVAFLFTLFWGGTLPDAAIAFPCGLITKYTVTLAKRFLQCAFGLLFGGDPRPLGTVFPRRTYRYDHHRYDHAAGARHRHRQCDAGRAGRGYADGADAPHRGAHRRRRRGGRHRHPVGAVTYCTVR